MRTTKGAIYCKLDEPIDRVFSGRFVKKLTGGSWNVTGMKIFRNAKKITEWWAFWKMREKILGELRMDNNYEYK